MKKSLKLNLNWRSRCASAAGLARQSTGGVHRARSARYSTPTADVLRALLVSFANNKAPEKGLVGWVQPSDCVPKIMGPVRQMRAR